MPSHNFGIHFSLAEPFFWFKAVGQMLKYFQPAILSNRYLSKLTLLIEKAVDTLVHS